MLTFFYFRLVGDFFLLRKAPKSLGIFPLSLMWRTNIIDATRGKKSRYGGSFSVLAECKSPLLKCWHALGACLLDSHHDESVSNGAVAALSRRPFYAGPSAGALPI